MDDPGLSRHDWESEWESLEDDLHTDPAHALPELDRLVTRMLEESGYEVTDPVVVEGEEREVIAEYISAHDVAVAVELRRRRSSRRVTSPPRSTATAPCSTTSSRPTPPPTQTSGRQRPKRPDRRVTLRP